MAGTIEANKVLKKYSKAHDDGERLAAHILDALGGELPEAVDISGLPAGHLISGFVNAFMDRLVAGGIPAEAASEVRWKCKYDSEEKEMRNLVAYYMRTRNLHAAT